MTLRLDLSTVGFLLAVVGAVTPFVVLVGWLWAEGGPGVIGYFLAREPAHAVTMLGLLAFSSWRLERLGRFLGGRREA